MAEGIPNAVQVRLSSSGIEFIETNIDTLASEIIGLLLPGVGSGDSISIPIPSDLLINQDLILTNAAIGLCLERDALREVSASVFVGSASTNSSPFTVRSPILAVADANGGGLISATHSVQIQRERSPGSDNWDNVCSASSVVVLGRFSNPVCSANLVPGPQYRLRVTAVGGGATANARVRLADPDGCSLNIELDDLDIAAVDGTGDTPDHIAVDVSILAQSFDGSGGPGTWPIRGYGIVPDCEVTADLSAGTSPDLDIHVEVAIVEQASGARQGYGKLEVLDVELVDPGIENADVDYECGGGVTAAIANLLRTFIIGTLVSTVEGLINGEDIIQQVADLPQPALPDPTVAGNPRTLCPSGSAARNGTCYQDTNNDGVSQPSETTPLPLLLGAEARVDFGGFLAGIVPGLQAVLDVVVALNGEGSAVNVSGGPLGFTLNINTGFRSAGGPVECVPVLENPPPVPTVPQAAAFRGGDDATHIVGGASEEMINYALYQIWNSGLLCLQVTNGLIPLLNASLLNSVISGLDRLVFPNAPTASLGFVLRPQQPPSVVFGAGTADDPLFTVSVPAVEVDFYAWSQERYVRYLTLSTDVTVPVNLNIDDGKVTLALGSIGLANSVVTNSELISGDPVRIAGSFSSLAGTLGSFVGALIPEFNVPELITGFGLNIGIDLQEGAVRLVESDGDRFIGGFIDITATETPTTITQRVETELELVAVNVPDTSYFDVETLGSPERVAEPPSIEIAIQAASRDGVEYEYQHRVDGQPWSEWSRSPYAVISHDVFIAQGLHNVEARSRVVGSSDSADLTPARAEFLLDVTAPLVETVISSGGTLLRAADLVSLHEALEYRYREVGTNEWSTWSTLGQPERLVADAAGEFEFEVRDEAGNVGRNTESLRGLPPPVEGGGGCGDCAAGETDASRPLYGLVSLLALGLMLRRKREG